MADKLSISRIRALCRNLQFPSYLLEDVDESRLQMASYYGQYSAEELTRAVLQAEERLKRMKETGI